MLHACEICGDDRWEKVIYNGNIRINNTGVEGLGIVKRCSGCGVDRLEERFALPQENYESDQYRAAMDQGLEVENFFKHADPTQIFNLSSIWPLDIRGKIIADVGCGAGSFLSYASGLASKVIAVEPTKRYHASLNDSGYEVFSYAKDALDDYSESLDVVFSFQVIEHVENPLDFIRDLEALLKPGGHLILITPNRNDILLKLLPEPFGRFYYRRVHRWYFDEASLRNCLDLTSLKVEDCRFTQTYGLANAFMWMKDKLPTGHKRIDGIDKSADSLWRTYLEYSGQSDNLVMVAKKTKKI